MALAGLPRSSQTVAPGSANVARLKMLNCEQTTSFVTNLRSRRRTLASVCRRLCVFVSTVRLTISLRLSSYCIIFVACLHKQLKIERHRMSADTSVSLCHCSLSSRIVTRLISFGLRLGACGARASRWRCALIHFRAPRIVIARAALLVKSLRRLTDEEVKETKRCTQQKFHPVRSIRMIINIRISEQQDALAKNGDTFSRVHNASA